jgi:hypothetical protein
MEGGSKAMHYRQGYRQACTAAKSGRAFSVVSFVYFSVECPFNKFNGIDCRPKLGSKLRDRFSHRRRQVSPPVNRLTHRFFDGFQHLLYCNFTVGSRHGAVASFAADKLPQTAALLKATLGLGNPLAPRSTMRVQ